MPQYISLNELFTNIDFFVQQTKQWKIFLYPTDTIYWIGWLWENTLEKIYFIKQRPQNKKVSIILPAQNLDDFLDKVKNISAQKFDTSAYKKLIQQIRKNSQWFTLIIQAKPEFFSILPEFWKKVYKDNTIGIRFLNHPFQKFVNKLNNPFITTSANLSGQTHITHPSKLEPQVAEKIDLIINDGTYTNPPSVLIKDGEIIFR